MRELTFEEKEFALRINKLQSYAVYFLSVVSFTSGVINIAMVVTARYVDVYTYLALTVGVFLLLWGVFVPIFRVKHDRGYSATLNRIRVN